MQTFEVDFFDGVSSKKTPLTLEIHKYYILFVQTGWKFYFDDIKVSTKMKNIPQTITLPNSSYCILKPNDTFELKKSIVTFLESKFLYALIATITIVLISVFLLTYGSSWSSKIIAEHIPQYIVKDLNDQSLSFIESHFLKPSKLPEETKQQIEQSFLKIVPKNVHVKLHFYSSPLLGPNAFALPAGDIVLLDELVKLEKDPKYRGILGVLAHETGHVINKHSLKNIVKTSITGGLTAYFIGDFSSLVAILSASAINMKYSRDFEKEADNEAIKIMKKHNYDLKPLANLFIALQKETHSEKENGFFLSSHPMFKDRIKNFKNAQ